MRQEERELLRRLNDNLIALGAEFKSYRESQQREFSAYRASQEKILRELKSMLETNRRELFGFSSDTGIRSRVKALEDKEANRTRHLFALWVAAVSALLKSLWDWLTH